MNFGSLIFPTLLSLAPGPPPAAAVPAHEPAVITALREGVGLPPSSAESLAQKSEAVLDCGKTLPLGKDHHLSLSAAAVVRSHGLDPAPTLEAHPDRPPLPPGASVEVVTAGGGATFVGPPLRKGSGPMIVTGLVFGQAAATNAGQWMPPSRHGSAIPGEPQVGQLGSPVFGGALLVDTGLRIPKTGTPVEFGGSFRVDANGKTSLGPAEAGVPGDVREAQGPGWKIAARGDIRSPDLEISRGMTTESGLQIRTGGILGGDNWASRPTQAGAFVEIGRDDADHSASFHVRGVVGVSNVTTDSDGKKAGGFSATIAGVVRLGRRSVEPDGK